MEVIWGTRMGTEDIVGHMKWEELPSRIMRKHRKITEVTTTSSHTQPILRLRAQDTSRRITLHHSSGRDTLRDRRRQGSREPVQHQMRSRSGDKLLRIPGRMYKHQTTAFMRWLCRVYSTCIILCRLCACDALVSFDTHKSISGRA